MSTQTFPVTGLTCGHCVGAITSELSVLAGVTTDKELTDDEVVLALDEAGEYKLTSV
jgi:copper chaperone